MTTTYSVHVEVGSYSWDVTGNDTDGDLPAAYGLADPLIISQRWPDSDLAPNVQPDPMEATLSVIAPDSTTYAFSVGDPVAVEFYTQGGFTGPTQQFYGRVASATGKPHDLGVFYTLGCVDYTIDLQQTDPVGGTAYPAEDLVSRLARIMADARVPMMATYPTGSIISSNLLKSRAPSPASCYDLIMTLLSEWRVNEALDEFGNPVTGGLFGRHFTRPTLRQFISNKRLYPVTPFYLDWRDQGRKISYAPPGRLASVAGLLSITMATANSSPTTGAPIIDGGNVNLDTTFSQVKGASAVSRVTVTDGDGTIWGAGDSGGSFFTVYYPTLPATTNVQADVSAPDWPAVPGEGGALQLLYAPDQATGRPDQFPQWSVGELTWEAWHEPVGWKPPVLGQLLTVARVVASKVPTRKAWLSGIISGWTLTVAAGRPRVAISLESPGLNTAQWNRNQLGASLGVVSWDSPIVSTVTFAGLSTTDSFDDYRLVRGS